MDELKSAIHAYWFHIVATIITFTLLIGSFIAIILSGFFQRINSRIAGRVLVCSFILFVILYAMIPAHNNPLDLLPGFYAHAISDIYSGNYPEALESLQKFKDGAEYLKRDVASNQPQEDSFYYLGNTDNLISSLDGGTLEWSGLQACISNNELSAIGYIWNKEAERVFLNIFPPGVAYLAVTKGEKTKVADILGKQFEGSGYSIDIDTGKGELGNVPHCLGYKSDALMSSVVKALADDSFFKLSKSDRTQSSAKAGQLPRPAEREYFAIYCNGKQMNGYWSPPVQGEIPWSEFRQTMLDIIDAALNSGSEISPDDYIEAVKEAEKNSGVQLLSGYYFSNNLLLLKKRVDKLIRMPETIPR
jgi:hypothetical protein